MEKEKRIEHTFTEYKSKLETNKPKTWLKAIVAFANTAGGRLIFGVDDKTREVIGIDSIQETLSKINEFINARIAPIPRYSISEIELDPKRPACIEIVVENGPHYPYYYVHENTKEAYVRRGDRSEPAKEYELNNLVLKGQHRTYDTLPGNYKLEDVSFTLLSATYKKETEENFDLTKDLLSMGLTTLSGQVTNAGLLLCDQGFIKHSKIVCTRWKGKYKGSVEGDALDDKEYSNESLISLLNDAESFIRNNSKNPWTIRGMRREENSDYPYKAVREVLVNAMIHRDYQIIGSEIHVDMFDDRLEVTSPGGMLSGKRIQELDLRRVPSMRRNEIIADFFGRLHYMDRRGSGIGRILSSYSNCTVKPEFQSDADYFFVMLPNRSLSKDSTFDKNNDEKVDVSGAKVEISKGKVDVLLDVSTEEDWELKYFKDHVFNKVENNFRDKRKNQIIMLFEKYRYEYTFSRNNISEQFEVVENTASIILKKCITLGLVEKEDHGRYRFSKK